MAKCVFCFLFIEHKNSSFVYLICCLTSPVKINKQRAAVLKGREYLKHVMYQCEENVVVFLVSVLKKKIKSRSFDQMPALTSVLFVIFLADL